MNLGMDFFKPCARHSSLDFYNAPDPNGVKPINSVGDFSFLILDFYLDQQESPIFMVGDIMLRMARLRFIVVF